MSESRRANPFSEDTPDSRVGNWRCGSLRTVYDTIEGQYFVSLKLGLEQLPNYLVIGAPGSGKSSLLRALRQRLSLPRAPWNLDALPLPLSVDLAAMLTATGQEEVCFAPERFYAHMQDQLIPTIRETAVMHPAAADRLSGHWEKLRESFAGDDCAALSHQGTARAIQALCEVMAVQGLPVDDGDGGSIAEHWAERYCRELALQEEFARALDRLGFSARQIDTPELACGLMDNLHIRRTSAEVEVHPEAQHHPTPRWAGKQDFREFLEHVFALYWREREPSIRYVPVLLVDGLDAFIKFDPEDPKLEPHSRVDNPESVAGLLWWMRALHEATGVGTVLASRYGPMSYKPLHRGASTIDIAYQIRVEPCPEDIDSVLANAWEGWSELDAGLITAVTSPESLEWIRSECGGVPGIAKRLCAALWDEVLKEASPRDEALQEGEERHHAVTEASKARALDSTYEGLRQRFIGMLGSAANGGYSRPLELLERARRDGSISADEHGVRALTVMGLLVNRPDGSAVLGMPGLTQRFFDQFGPDRRSDIHMTRSERRLYDVLRAAEGGTVSYREIAAYLVEHGVWRNDILEQSEEGRLPNRVAVLAGRLRSRLEDGGAEAEVLPVRAKGYMLREISR